MTKTLLPIGTTVIALLALVLTAAPVPAGPGSGDTRDRIGQKLESIRGEMIEFHRDLHAHPEVGGKEERTAKAVAERLESLSLEVQTGIGGHGVVAVLQGGKPGPVVAYRADMDAMASPAPDPVEYRSKNPGVRHICGHDMHTTVAIALAEALASIRKDLPGTVKFIFQPAEETALGARAMIEDGVLENPSPMAIFALHCGPLPVGQIGSIEGLALPGIDVIELTLSGSGDLMTVAQGCANVIGSVSTISPPLAAKSFSDFTQDGDFAFAGLIGSEELPESNQLKLQAIVRASDTASFKQAKKDIEQGLAALDMGDVTFELSYTSGALPAMVNDADLVRSSLDPIRSAAGNDGLVLINKAIPFFSEDFSYFQQHIPGAMFFLGVSNQEKGILGVPHSPGFAADEEAILVGARTMAAVLLEYLEN